jgi:hypothetical protein
MSDQKQHEQAKTEQPKTEQTKTKVGDKVEAEQPKAATTKIDGAAAKERKPRVTAKNATYRILSEVDAAKYNGQRGHVIRALQKLAKQHGPDKYFTVDEVASATENLVSRTPVEASVAYHLKGMTGNEVSAKLPEPPAKKEEKKEETAA